MKANKKATVSIVFAFNNHYSMAGAVAINSLLSNINQDYVHLYVLHSDISSQNQQKIKETVSKYKNAQIEFMDLADNFLDVWASIKHNTSYTKECLYKLMLPEIFTEIPRIIVSDVDVVFKGDITGALELVNDSFYISGYRPPGKLLKIYDDSDSLTPELREKLKDGIGAGFMIYNLELMRKDKVYLKMLRCLEDHKEIIVQPEQDVINIALHGKIGYLPLEYCFCTYMYNLYRRADDFNLNPRGYALDYLLKTYRNNLNDDANYSEKELLNAFQKPLQIHYASDCKPWDYIFTKRKIDWLKHLIRTPYIYTFIKEFPLRARNQHKPRVLEI